MPDIAIIHLNAISVKLLCTRNLISYATNKRHPKEISSYYMLYEFINILVSVYFDTYITYFIFLSVKDYLLFMAIAVYIELFLDQISIWDN